MGSIRNLKTEKLEGDLVLIMKAAFVAHENTFRIAAWILSSMIPHSESVKVILPLTTGMAPL